MNLDSILPTPGMTEAEMTQIITLLSDSLIQKYLKEIANVAAKELLLLPSVHSTAEEIHKAHLVTTGRLELITSLLHVTK